jgi:serine/threonine-protein kinase
MIRVVLGALADQTADAVLRPVRSDLEPVSAAARDVGQRAGEDVAERLRAAGQVPVGGAVLTPGGALLAGFVIHVVVMSPDEPQSRASVDRALRNGLGRAGDWGLGSLALPVLGLGAGSLDPEDAAAGLLRVLRDHERSGALPTELVLVAVSEFEKDLLERFIASDAAKNSSAGNRADRDL